jgi:hypothetical protein
MLTDPVDVVSRPFATFFAEVFADVCRPRRDIIGTARLPEVERDDIALDLCVECLRPKSECACD